MNRPQDVEVREIVNIVRMCQGLQALPRAGGLLDQDSYFVYLLSVVLSADAEKEKMEESRARLRGRH
jgi:hypothetical protein